MAKSCKRPRPVRLVTDKQLARMVASGKPVAAKFFSPFCTYCEEAAPEVNAAACELGGDVEVVAVNVDLNEAIARKYKIDALPTVAVFKGGQLVKASEGALKKPEYVRTIKKILKGGK